MNPGGPTELTDEHDQHVIGHPPLLKIFDQCTDRLVKLGPALAHDLKDIAMYCMVIPTNPGTVIVSAAIGRKSNRHNPGPRFDKAASEQALLASQVIAIPFSQRHRFPGKVESSRGSSAGQQVERLLSKTVNCL
jgi:hypothetical protein